jgi:hypothetical protein
MTKIIDGRKAEITEKGRIFSTYNAFAVAHGYPDASAESDSTDTRKKPENGDTVTLLTYGPHLTGYPGSTLWIVQAANGERHIINESGLRIQPAELSGVTLLPDESIGGISREYREVKRKAAVGETVIMTEATGVRTEGGREVPDYRNGEIFVIDHISGGLAGSTSGKLFYHREYSVLEPTEILRIDGERLRLVDRKAAVGDRVIIVNDRCGSGGSDGEFFRVGNVGVYCGGNDVDFSGQGNDYVYPNGKWSVNPDARRVLEPVESAASALLSAQPAESQAAANIANLALRLTQAEAKITALESVIAERKVASGPVDSALPSFASLGVMKSAQEIRDEIVERAKADVEAVLSRNYPSREGYSPSVWFTEEGGVVITDACEFIVNREKGTVVALIRSVRSHIVFYRGKARCTPGETFNVHIGKAIAVRRALGLTVPAEYLDAPGPTEVRVGDVVTGKSTSFTIVNDIVSDRDKLSLKFANSLLGGTLRITDDSRDEDGGQSAPSSALKGAA